MSSGAIHIGVPITVPWIALPSRIRDMPKSASLTSPPAVLKTDDRAAV